MATNVVMPQLGESVVEGTIGKWFKQVGDKIEQYESIMEVVTDKVTTEIPSPAAGTVLKILVPEGTTVNAGTVLAIIGAPGETVAAEAVGTTVAAPTAVPGQPAARAAQKSTNLRLTPVVARMIAENNISDAELATLHGTGEGGRVSKKDIESLLSSRGEAPKKTEMPAWEQPGTGDLFRPTEEVLGQPAAVSTPTLLHPAQGESEEIIPLSPMRKAIAEHMVRSKRVAPHVTTVHEADMSRVMAYHKAHEAEYAKQGVKLTFTAFFVQAAVAALKAFPIVNATFTDQGILMKRKINIGIAVALEDGLIVPVIKNADEKSLLGIARAVNDLAARAREKRLLPDEVQGGTLTITNYGVFGSLFGTPVINQPQSAILGVGAIQKRVVIISTPARDRGIAEDAMVIRPMIYLALTFDHRLLDGAVGDQFMSKFKRFLEEHPTA